MGQARRRGSFEHRKEEAILRKKECIETKRSYNLEHPRRLGKPILGAALPLYAALSMSNMFEYQNPFGNGFQLLQKEDKDE